MLFTISQAKGEMAINKLHLLNRKKAFYQLQIGIISIPCKGIVFFRVYGKKKKTQ